MRCGRGVLSGMRVVGGLELDLGFAGGLEDGEEEGRRESHR